MHDETLALYPEPAQPAAYPSPSVHRQELFEFRGSAREYFRIWTVNLALNIVTLGIYSAWASVRTRRYLYANTWLSGSPFEYSAQPLPILRGRLIAVLVFGCYILADRISPWLKLAAAGVLAVVLPWLLVRGLAFRARYSSWRGLPFRFEPDFKGAYIWYLAVYVLMIPTIGLIYPWIKARQQQWTVQHHHYGNSRFNFETDVTDYYLVLFATIGIAILVMLIMAAVVAAGMGVASMHVGNMDPKRHPLLFLLTMYAMYLPAYLAIYSYNRSRMLNLLYNGARLAGGRLRSTLGFWAMFWIYLSNLAAIICTIGLAVPWAKVRTVRYRASHMVLETAGDLDAFVAETRAQPDVGALGAEMDGLFSIDIGL